MSSSIARMIANSTETPRVERSLYRILAVLGGAAMCLAPIWPSTSDAELSGLQIMVGGVVLMAAGLALLLFREWPQARIAGAVGLILLWSTLSHTLGIAPFHSGQYLAIWFAGYGVMLAFALGSADRQAIRGTLHAYILTAAGLTIYAFSQAHLAAGEGSTSVRLFTATFENYDSYGVALLLGIGAATGLLHRSGRIEKYYLQALSCFLTLGLFFSGSRSAIFGTVVLLGWVTWGEVRRKQRGSKHASVSDALLPFFAALCILCVVIASSEKLNPLGRFREVVEQVNEVGVRLMVLQRFLVTWWHSPIWGYGPNMFAQAFQPYRPHGAFIGYINEAHMEPVQILVDLGIVGLGLVVGLLLLIRNQVTQRGKRTSTGERLSVGSILGLWVYSFTNFWLPVAGNVLPVGAIFGLVEDGWTGKTWRPPAWLRIVLCVGLVGTATWTCSVGHQAFQVQTLGALAAGASSNGLYQDALGYMDAAINIEPDNERLWLEHGRTAESLLGQMLGSTRLYRYRPERLQDIIQNDVRHAMAINPEGKDTRVFSADLLRRIDQGDQALLLLQEATRRYPQDWRAWKALGALYVDRQQMQPAAEAYLHACDADPACTASLGMIVGAMETDEAGTAGRLLQSWRKDGRIDEAQVLKIALSAAAICAQMAPEKALAFCPILEKAGPDNPTVLTQAGAIYLAAGKSRAARATLEKAWQVHDSPDGQSWQARQAALTTELKLVTDPEKTPLLRSYLKLYPSDNQVRCMLAAQLAAEQSWQESVDTWEEAIERDPRNAGLQVSLAQTYTREGLPACAADAYAKAAELDKNNPQWAKLARDLKKEAPRLPPAPGIP